MAPLLRNVKGACPCQTNVPAVWHGVDSDGAMQGKGTRGNDRSAAPCVFRYSPVPLLRPAARGLWRLADCRALVAASRSSRATFTSSTPLIGSVFGKSSRACGPHGSRCACTCLRRAAALPLLHLDIGLARAIARLAAQAEAQRPGPAQALASCARAIDFCHRLPVRQYDPVERCLERGRHPRGWLAFDESATPVNHVLSRPRLCRLGPQERPHAGPTRAARRPRPGQFAAAQGHPSGPAGRN
jgi:hypothetical protein